MIDAVHCGSCGREVPRPSGPGAACPACRAPLAPGAQAVPARTVPAGVEAVEVPFLAGDFEDLELGPEPGTAPSPPSPSRPDALGEAPASRHTQSESSRAAARMANVPTFKAASARGGFPILPIGMGLALILGVTAFALLRGRPAAPAVVAAPSRELEVARIGRPPEPSPSVSSEPDPPAPVVTMDLPADEIRVPRPRPKPHEREARARPARPAAPPAREVTRPDKPASNRLAPAPAPAPAPRVEPDPVPPPQFVAAPPAEPPSLPAPLAIGPSFAREGYQKARPSTPGCVAASLRLPRDIADVSGASATVKFAVDETGKVSQFSYLSGPDEPRIGAAIWAAVQRCEWTPGATGQGKPIALWVTMPIKFGR